MAHLTIIIIFPSFPSFLPSLQARLAVKMQARQRGGVDRHITYISVSKSTPLAVTGPHGQLASIGIPHQYTDISDILRYSVLKS